MSAAGFQAPSEGGDDRSGRGSGGWTGEERREKRPERGLQPDPMARHTAPEPAIARNKLPAARAAPIYGERLSRGRAGPSGVDRGILPHGPRRRTDTARKIYM